MDGDMDVMRPQDGAFFFALNRSLLCLGSISASTRPLQCSHEHGAGADVMWTGAA